MHFREKDGTLIDGACLQRSGWDFRTFRGGSTSGISETFGHESEATTDDFYGHDVPELKQQAIDALAQVLKKPGEEDESQSKPQSI